MASYSHLQCSAVVVEEDGKHEKGAGHRVNAEPGHHQQRHALLEVGGAQQEPVGKEDEREVERLGPLQTLGGTCF